MQIRSSLRLWACALGCLVGAVLAAGCGSDEAIVDKCTPQGLEYVAGEIPFIDCQRVQHNVDLARRLLDENGIVSTEEFPSMFRSVTVTVKDTDAIRFIDGAPHCGFYAEWSWNIDLDRRDMECLLHEFLHHVENYRGRGVRTVMHWEWEEKGWNDVARQYDNWRTPTTPREYLGY